MTSSPAVARAHFEDLDSALAALRENGMRVTLARRAILRALFDADAPLTVEAILARAAGEERSLDAASVYRSLEAFEHGGIVRHVHLGHGAGLYALVGEGEREYIYCEHCGATRSLRPRELDPVRALVRKRFGYDARFTHFPIVGLCSDCRRAGGRAGA